MRAHINDLIQGLYKYFPKLDDSNGGRKKTCSNHFIGPTE
jgi:hypothetical protein